MNNKIEYLKIDSITLFWYICIFIVIIFIFSQKNIGLNIVFGTVIAGIIIYWLYSDYQRIQDFGQTQLNEKKNLITPKPINSLDHPQIVNFLYSIQDLYTINPQSYELMVYSIDNFFVSYDEVLNNDSLAGLNYQIMSDQKKESVNALQSIIYKMKRDTKYDAKLDLSVATLKKILDKYLIHVEYVYKDYIYINGYTVNTQLINKGPNAYDPYEMSNIESTYYVHQ